MILRHICEVCSTEQTLTPEDAYEAGWDYPPKMGIFGIVSPRVCPRCSIAKTVWWAMEVDHYTDDMLTAQQTETLQRIYGEPDSIAATQ